MDDTFEVVLSSWFHDEASELSDEHRAWIARKLSDLRKKPWDAAVRDRTIAPLRDGI